MRLFVISLILLFIPFSNIYGEEFSWPMIILIQNMK